MSQVSPTEKSPYFSAQIHIKDITINLHCWPFMGLFANLKQRLDKDWLKVYSRLFSFPP